MSHLKSVNPATGETIARYPVMKREEIDRRIDKAARAQLAWQGTTFGERARLMRKAAQVLRKRQEALAGLMAAEMGKPLQQGRDEAEKCAVACEFYADHAEAFLKPETVESDAEKSYVAFQPLGLVLAIMPWNFPFWQVIRFAAPALMAGNGGVLKHASNVCGCALALEEIFGEAGFPKHLFTTLLLPSKQIAPVIAHPLIRAVTLTGSVGAGKSVAAAAGAQLKKTVLELGGSDPYLVLADADMELAVKTCVAARLINSGQSCIAAKRFIVEKAVAKEFTRRFVEAFRAVQMGDPREQGVSVGPQASRELRDQLHEQVMSAVEAGAKLLLGGVKPKGKGAYYPPTVLAKVKPGNPAFEEEMFGPVAAIIEAKDEADAVRLANLSVFGLGSAVFSRDEGRAERVALQLEAGSAFVNSQVKSDPRLPFGGVKESGYGRELSSFGIREFTNIKTVSIGTAKKPARKGTTHGSE